MDNQEQEVKERNLNVDSEVIQPNFDQEGTPDESSTEQKPGEETSETKEDLVKNEPEEENSGDKQSEDEQQPVEKQEVIIKDVEGETPREKALRLEITKLRGQIREKNSITPPSKDVDNNLVSKGYHPEEIKKVKELLNDLGYVNKDEIQKSEKQKVIDSFINKHPEYLPQNDKDDVLWNAVNNEFNSGFYNNRSDNPVVISKILEDIHAKLNSSKSNKTVNQAAISAQQAKIKSAGVGNSGVQPPTSTKSKTIDPNVKAFLKDFTDEELADISSK